MFFFNKALYKRIFTSKHQRSSKIKKNIFGIFTIKGFNIAITFILYPLTINYVSPSEYGVWLTLGSMIGWFNYFDFGLTNGLRNHLAEAFSKDDIILAKKLISTTYAILFLGIMGLSLLVIPSIHFINWKVFLNSPKSDERELVNLAYIVFISFCLRFFLQVITTMLLAAQKPALNNLSGLLSNALSLGIVIFLIHTTKASMFILGTTLSLSPIIILLIFTLYFFKTKFRSVQPELSFIDFGYAKNLFSLGIQFFIIQIAGLVLFSLSNLLITNYFSPTMVTTYNLAYKYFSTVYLIFNMVLTPYWSAYTDAFVKKDFLWIKNATKKLQKMWGAFVIISILMLLISDYFFKLWIKDVVTIPFSLSIAFTLFFIFNSYSAIYIAFINGVSKIRLSIIQSVFEIIIFLPLVYLLLKVIKLDISGIVIASMISPIIAILWMPIQYNRIITNKAKGIWNK